MVLTPADARASGAGAIVLALARVVLNATASCAVCGADVRVGELRPLVRDLPGLLACPACVRVASPPAGPDPLS